jgi:hypothetical protein
VPRLVALAEPPPPVVERRDEVVIETREPRRGNGRRVLAGGFTVIGLAALGTGVAFGLRARELEAEADEICPETVCADPAGLAKSQDAQDMALGANVLFAAGGVAAVTAVILWVTGKPERGRGTVTVVGSAAGDVGLGLQGSF